MQRCGIDLGPAPAFKRTSEPLFLQRLDTDIPSQCFHFLFVTGWSELPPFAEEDIPSH
jgi:hypothetical protein